MLGINEMNQELVRAFNINLCYNDIAITNLTVQNLDGKDHIVISFDKNMDSKQCVKYLNNMKEKIIKRSYRDEKVAGVSYNLKFFPFAFNTKHLPRDDKGRKKFSVEIDEGVIFNLKCYLAKALVGDVKERMGREFGVERIKKSIYDTSFDRNSYLYCMLFHDKGIQKYFIDLFSSKIARYEENAPRDYLEIIGNCVYIKKSIFDNIEFIKDIEAHNASLICRDFQTPSSKDKGVEDLKFPIISFIRKTGIPVHSVIRTSYEGSNEDSVLIPIVAQNGKVNRLLNDNDAYRISSAFDMEILSNVSESISARLPKSGSFDGVVYGIDFSDLDISHCVITKIIESSVINKDHELAIDPELRLQALSPAQSPFNSPTHAEPPRTPPEQTGARFFESEGNRDSGIGESPPRPEDSVAHSSSDDPGSFLEQSQAQRFPTWNQGVAKDSPRQGSEKKQVLHNPVNLAGTSKGFSPSSSVQSVSAAQNVRAGTSASFQPIGFWSSPTPSAEPSLWQPSRPLSRKGANESGSAWTSASSWPSQSTSGNKWQLPLQLPEPGLSGLSWKGADKNVRTTWYVPPPTPPLTTKNDPTFSSPEFSARSPGVEDVNGVESEKQQVIVQGARGEPLAPLASDKSDQESSDECSEAKLQESESPKKHGGGTILNKILSPLKRNNKKRSSTSSSVSAPGGFVTEKPLLFKRSASERRVESNPSTSPTHLPKAVVESNVSEDCNTSVNSDYSELFDRLQSPAKTSKIQDILKRIRKNFSRHSNSSDARGKTTQDIIQFDEKTFSSFSPGLQEILSLPLSLDMIRNLFPYLPMGKQEKLILLAHSEEVKKSHSSPEEIEQLLSSLLPEEKELCLFLFFPWMDDVMYVGLSPGAKKQMDPLWKALAQGMTSFEDSGIFSKSSSQKSTSDTENDKDELETSSEFSHSGRSSVSSNSSTSTVRTKMDSSKAEKHLQEKGKFL